MKIHSFVILFAMLFSSIAITACEGDDNNPSEFQSCDYNPYMPGDILEQRLPNGQVIRTEVILGEYEGRQYLTINPAPGQPQSYIGCEGDAVVQIAPGTASNNTGLIKTKQLEFPISLGRKWELAPTTRVFSEIDQSETVTVQEAEISSLSKRVESFDVAYDAIESTETITFVILQAGDTVAELNSTTLRYWVAGEGLVLTKTFNGDIEQRRVAQ